MCLRRTGWGWPLRIGHLPSFLLGDFDQCVAGTGSDNLIIFPDKTIDRVMLQITPQNEATGFALTETENAVVTLTAADGQTKEAGLFWHLRSPEGEIVCASFIVFLIALPTGRNPPWLPTREQLGQRVILVPPADPPW